MSNRIGWVIVNIDDWSSRFEQDPEHYGALLKHSCYENTAAMAVGVQEYYVNKETAEKDCVKINKCDIYARYAVCPLLDEFDSCSNTDLDDDDD